MCTVKKYQKSLNVNIFVRISFENKTKKWNSIFTITNVPCKFQQNLSKKMALGTNGIKTVQACIFHDSTVHTPTTIVLRRVQFCAL
jgi:hypothetical protein